MRKARIFGLTGGIASGKSTAGRIFASLGFLHIDADEIARRLRSPGGAAHPSIIQTFGTADPTQLKEIVLKDARERKKLEEILHPLIRKEAKELIATQSSQSSTPVFVIYEAALLAESGNFEDLEGVVVVEAPENLRMDRLKSHRRMKESEAQAFLLAQLKDEDRKKLLKHLPIWVIDNSGSETEFRDKIRNLAEKLRK